MGGFHVGQTDIRDAIIFVDQLHVNVMSCVNVVSCGVHDVN